MGSVPFQIIIPGSLNNNTLEFLFWDDIWSQPCFVQCVKDMMRIWYDMIWWRFSHQPCWTPPTIGHRGWPWNKLRVWDGKSHGKSTKTMENEASMILNPEMVKFAPYFLETLSNTLWGLLIHAPFFAGNWFFCSSRPSYFPWVKYWVKTL